MQKTFDISSASGLIIGIVGSRRRNDTKDYMIVRDKFFELCGEDDIICSGGCSRGGDSFAHYIAQNFGIPIIVFYPNWKDIGRSAGFVRNTYIAQISDILIACVSEDRRGGTEDTIHKFLRYHKKEYLHIV